ncbi:AfsR/SARP family transcriptional regulator [Actinopolymorpha alba]|uniref:AfsR/SARP family transcriptional regulator n=1 Tax=Actinopolymorpha alba TaxID=533267 RepID=UPI00037F258F|nr:BTAD domain-containing putative transcriptional regulator [Actinopolymorpha alba]
MPEVFVHLLGPFEVRVGKSALAVPSNRQRILLASLALSAGSPVPVDTLAERIWGAELPLDPRGAIHNYVSRLRRSLGAGRIQTVDDGYLLDVAPDQVDAVRFLALVRQATAAEPGRRRELLGSALTLWRGDPLGGLDSGSLERDYAPMLTERYLTAVEHRVDLDLDRGDRDPGELIGELRSLAGQFPVRESLWIRLLTVLWRYGRQAEALEAYETVRRFLAGELGADPSSELRQLHQQILTGRAAQGPRPAGMAPEDSRTRPTSSRTNAGSRSPLVPRQLPRAAAGFVGRMREITMLDTLLDDWSGNDVVIAAIHGAGGVGKTAVAVHWAHRRLDRFPGGQLYLDLHGYGPGSPVGPEVALRRLLRSLDVPAGRIPDGIEEAAALLRTELAGRRMLLLLDNARDPEHVRPLLPGSGCFVLVTSRNQLRGLSIHDGARQLPLRELPDADATEVLAAGIGTERVTDEPHAVGELLHLCGRLPLALRIAADLGSRHPDVPLAHLVAQLRDHRLEPLSDQDPRSDLRATFAWSYDSLAPDLARAFRLLGGYPGGDIGVPGAAALLDVEHADARGLLDGLADVHLLEGPRPGRYRLHDLLREYAVELAAGEPETERVPALRRVLDWYLHATNDARSALGFARPHTLRGDINEPELSRPHFGDSAQAFEWYEFEREALVAATASAARHGLCSHAWQLSRALRDFLDRRKYVDEWIIVSGLGFECARHVGDSEAIYFAALSLGAARTASRGYDEAEAVLLIALDHAGKLSDPVAESRALSVLGLNSERAKEYDRACAYHHEAEIAARRCPLPVVRAHALLNYGGTEILAERYYSGIAHSRQALEIYQEHGVELQQALALGNLGEAYERTGDSATALTCCESASSILRRLQDSSGLVDALTTLGRIQAATGQSEAARASWQEALSHLRPDNPRHADVETLLDSLNS